MTCSTVLQKYNKRIVVEIEVWVSHRSESNIMHISDPSDKEWRACVRHSDGKMEWEWCKTFDDAVAWCERYSPNAIRWSEQQKTWVEDVWEPCPLHEHTRCASAHCKLCKGEGEVLIEMESNLPNTELSGGIPHAESDCSVIEMGLCEVEHVMLRPNQLYRFVVMPNCDKCKSLDVYHPTRRLT